MRGSGLRRPTTADSITTSNPRPLPLTAATPSSGRGQLLVSAAGRAPAAAAADHLPEASPAEREAGRGRFGGEQPEELVHRELAPLERGPRSGLAADLDQRAYRAGREPRFDVVLVERLERRGIHDPAQIEDDGSIHQSDASGPHSSIRCGYGSISIPGLRIPAGATARFAACSAP